MVRAVRHAPSLLMHEVAPEETQPVLLMMALPCPDSSQPLLEWWPVRWQLVGFGVSWEMNRRSLRTSVTNVSAEFCIVLTLEGFFPHIFLFWISRCGHRGKVCVLRA